MVFCDLKIGEYFYFVHPKNVYVKTGNVTARKHDNGIEDYVNPLAAIHKLKIKIVYENEVENVSKI